MQEIESSTHEQTPPAGSDRLPLEDFGGVVSCLRARTPKSAGGRPGPWAARVLPASPPCRSCGRLSPRPRPIRQTIYGRTPPTASTTRFGSPTKSAPAKPRSSCNSQIGKKVGSSRTASKCSSAILNHVTKNLTTSRPQNPRRWGLYWGRALCHIWPLNCALDRSTTSSRRTLTAWRSFYRIICPSGSPT
jgi:hypothetical protein